MISIVLSYINIINNFHKYIYEQSHDGDLVAEMLNCVGLVEEMPEELMDAVTGLSGNGPAYVSPALSLHTQSICIILVLFSFLQIINFFPSA